MTISANNIKDLFTVDIMKNIFPEDRANLFFDALFGDASEGAYDIALEFRECSQDRLEFEFHLKQRQGKCLACNLTYGLPDVFSRHPVINIKGVVQEIDKLVGGQAKCAGWRLGATQEISKELHVIPLTVRLDSVS
ncbi:MAG: pancreas/duodenum homeobox protein 1 [Desulfobacterales bacterium]|nr:pancreas/duodenum homeobox protein 1 [Desulfobacterales bacterium]